MDGAAISHGAVFKNKTLVAQAAPPECDVSNAETIRLYLRIGLPENRSTLFDPMR